MRTVTFEQKLEESKKILNQLLDPDITLEESLKLYENGIKEIKSAQKMIEEAKVKIELIEDKV
ncbi:Exodeoxyribonuclease VII small subunit [hydrothermal vent metagenome]|uniref:Exodeoxyribonuclease VII small subunit n=1 Tax=hydrothermal vent metagenome TaxID=652676 RepID=A0A1W1C9F4_9ZZZZ